VETLYDLVIIDSTAILGTIEAIQIGSICNGMLLVGRINLVTRSDFSQTINLLQKLNVVGVVANGVGDLPSYMRTTSSKKNQSADSDEDEDEE
jgi:Mrp family chromosome partitioning ATPase